MRISKSMPRTYFVGVVLDVAFNKLYKQNKFDKIFYIKVGPFQLLLPFYIYIATKKLCNKKVAYNKTLQKRFNALIDGVAQATRSTPDLHQMMSSWPMVRYFHNKSYTPMMKPIRNTLYISLCFIS